MARAAAMHASGVIDVQSHTDSHSRIFASPDVEDFVQPGYEATPLLNRPQLVRAAAARVRDAGRSRRAALRDAIADVRRPPRARVPRRPHEMRGARGPRGRRVRFSRDPIGARRLTAIVAGAPSAPVRERRRPVARDRGRARPEPLDPERAPRTHIGRAHLPAVGHLRQRDRDGCSSAPAIAPRSPTAFAASTPFTPATIRTG